MNNTQVKKLVKQVFESINSANSLNALRGIPNQENGLIIEAAKIDQYPKINFSITSEEIQNLKEIQVLTAENLFSLKEIQVLTAENLFSQDFLNSNLNSVEKILLSIVWKNGDILKIKRIIEGIIDDEDEFNNHSDSLVFYGFGRYLRKDGNPIIDQHVIRAFSIYQYIGNPDQLVNIEEDVEFQKLRKLDSLRKRDISKINNYIKWVKDRNNFNLGDQPRSNEFFYEIDKILFSLGKKIKLN